MKKYILTSGIVLTTLSSLYAQNSVPAVAARPAMGMGVMMRASSSMMMSPMTGDATTDAAIRALEAEMEAKIKAIREEYQVKIKAAIGDKKLINRPMMASGTARMMGVPGEKMMNGTATMMRRPEGGKPQVQNGSSTNPRPMMGKMDGQVKGVEISQDTEVKTGIFGFFGRMFSR